MNKIGKLKGAWVFLIIGSILFIILLASLLYLNSVGMEWVKTQIYFYIGGFILSLGMIMVSILLINNK